MKKWAFFLLILMSAEVYSMNVLVSYFDPFGGKSENNSEVYAKLIQQNLKKEEINIQICELRTVFDKAYDILQDCVHSQQNLPDLIISLGESGCKKITLETRGINFDKSIGPDNDGMERHSTPIIPDEEMYIGVTLPLEKAYCELASAQRRSFKISQSPGSFVCNNTLFHGLHKLDIPYTFIHVPSKSCTSDAKTKELSKDLSLYIQKLSEQNLEGTIQPKTKSEVKKKLDENLSECETKFYKKLKKDY